MVRRFRILLALSAGLSAALIELNHAMGDPLPASAGTVTLPPGDSGATYPGLISSIRFDSAGTLYAWDGQSIIQFTAKDQTSPGQVPAGNKSDPGPINFSQDGSQILVGNGAGGPGGEPYNGETFDLPKTGGGGTASLVGSVPYETDLIPVPATVAITGSASKYFVDQGNADFDGSSVSVFNSTDGSNQSVIANVPGASASITINTATNRLYVEDGYGNDPADTGDIRSFSLTSVASAINGNAVLDWSSGAVFTSGDPNQSGAGLFFDADGYLFSGGGAGITVFSPAGSLVFQQDPTGNSYSSLTYDPATDQFLEDPFADTEATLYNASSFESVPEPASIGVLMLAGAVSLGKRRVVRRSASICQSRQR